MGDYFYDLDFWIIFDPLIQFTNFDINAFRWVPVTSEHVVIDNYNLVVFVAAGAVFSGVFHFILFNPGGFVVFHAARSGILAI